MQNPGSCVVIPWSKIRKVGYEGGLRIELKGRAKPLRSAAYQGTLIGRLAGWSSSHKAALAIEKYQHEAAKDSGNSQIREAFPWRAHLLWFGIGWTVLAVVMPLLGRSVI